MDPTNIARTGGSTAATPPRVFLSHTSDLGKPDEPGSFVAAAVATVLSARHAVTDMAYFAARDTSPPAACMEMVAQSDVYVGIIGLRHGSPVRDRSDVSYTELEFEATSERGQPRLIFLIREDSRAPAAGGRAGTALSAPGFPAGRSSPRCSRSTERIAPLTSRGDECCRCDEAAGGHGGVRG